MLLKNETEGFDLTEKNYLVVTLKQWNIHIFHEVLQNYSGNWHLITNKEELTSKKVSKISPRYIFFPHWSHIVTDNIISQSECVCFHMTDLPFGRGGSPLQNLIKLGYKTTKISALQMTSELDAGPIYIKRNLSLHGSAEEIFHRTAKIISEMIKHIIEKEPIPKPQLGDTTTFKRRTPEQSKIDSNITNLAELYDHIRMLDADGYPKAFIDIGDLRFEFTKVELQNLEILSNVRIFKRNTKDND